MLTRKWTDPPMLRLEQYSSCDTPNHSRPPVPSRDSTWLSHSREQFFQDHQKESIYIRSGRDSLNFKKNKENFNKAHRGKDLCILKVKEQVQFFHNKQSTGPVKWTTGTVTEILELWMTLHGPGPQWQSLQKKQSSFEAHMS